MLYTPPPIWYLLAKLYVLKKLLYIILIAVLGLIIVILANTFMAKNFQPTGEALPLFDAPEGSEMRLAKSIQFATISEKSFYQDSTFMGMQQFLRSSYPLVFENLDVMTFGEHSMVMKWSGSEPELKPLLFLGHQDVVPIELVSANEWEQPPFSGKNDGEYIWGRGAIDDKSTVLGLLESTSTLLKEGFIPKRTIYFAFGEDEETMGIKGAQSISKYFSEQHLSFEAILDEGTFITQDIVPGISGKPVALIAIAEKGYLTIALTVDQEGGHSSMPASENAISILSTGITKLQENPFPYELSTPLQGFFEYLGPELSFTNRMAFANPKLMKSLIINAYSKLNSGKAMIQTTLAPTMLEAGIKDNVIPTAAKATLNLRILPGQTIKDVLAYLKETLADDRIKIQVKQAYEPSPVSNYKNKAFTQIGLAVKDVYPDAVITPSLMIASTDSKYFSTLSKNIYKFMPVLFYEDDLPRFHGVNERIGIKNYHRAIQIYTQLIRRWNFNWFILWQQKRPINPSKSFTRFTFLSILIELAEHFILLVPG